LELPEVVHIPGGTRGEVVAIDTFGNLLTNLERQHLEGVRNVRVQVRGVEIDGLVETFGNRSPGELVAMYDEEKALMIAVVNGNAQAKLGARVGDAVEAFS
jgi:S-adenosyl-L-methionine hydrolase (adenosine-forming)